uniref:hypothetical protein n=1 Tax=Methanobrevibacter smithii TaxID=2173 RepID=UPI003FF0E6AB
MVATSPNKSSNEKMLFNIKHKILIMKINEETKVRNQGEISLITTIPKTYVKALKIKSGDTLEWILDTETEKLELHIIRG